MSLPPEFLDAARALIAARSVTSEGNRPAVEVLERLFAGAGFSTRRLPSRTTPDRDANLLVSEGDGPLEDALLLITHLDTVSPGPLEAWSHDPFELVFRGDDAIGLGSADVKLDALCKLWAWRRVKDLPKHRPVAFLGTFGEEAGLRGTKEFLLDPPFRPFGALCGEPSSLRLCHAHKGYAMVRVRLVDPAPRRVRADSTRVVSVEGKAVHSSTPDLGVNAIDRFLSSPELHRDVVDVTAGESTNTVPGRCDLTIATGPGDDGGRPVVDALLPVVCVIQDRWRDLVESLQPLQDGRFRPERAVCSLTKLRTAAGPGGAVIEFHLDARLLPAHDARALLEPFRADLAARVAPFTVEVSVERDAGGLSVDDDDPFLRGSSEALAAAGLDPAPRAKPTSTEAGAFRRAGIPALVFGPSRSEGNAHTADERASLAELEQAIDAYEALLRRWCA